MSDVPDRSTPGSGPGGRPGADPAGSWNVPGGTPPGWGSPPPGSGWGPPADWSPAAEVRPGIIPLRPLALGEILDSAFSVVRRNANVTLGWSAIIIVISQVIGVGVGLLDGSLGTALNATGASATLGAGPIGGRVLTVVVSSTSAGLLTGFVAVIVADAVLGQQPTFGGVWLRVRPRLLPLFGAAVLAGVLPYLGLLVFILPGIFLWAALALAPPALVLERLSTGDSIRRSVRLVRGDWWRVFAIRVVAVLIAAALSLVLLVPAGILGSVLFRRTLATGDARPLGFLLLLAAVGTIGSILAQPFAAAVTALLYIDRRMRAEALDVALAQAAGGRLPGPAGLGTAAPGPPGAAGSPEGTDRAGP